MATAVSGATTADYMVTQLYKVVNELQNKL